MARAPLPPTLAPPSSAAARSRTRSTVASPASPLVSATGRTLTSPESFRCQAGPAGAVASWTPSTPPRRAAASARSVPAGTSTSMGGRAPLPPPAPPQRVKGLAGGTGLGEDGCRRLAQAQAEGGHAQGDEHRQRGQGGQPAVADHPGRPAGPQPARRPPPRRALGAGRPGGGGTDGGQQHRQQGEVASVAASGISRPA